MEVVIVLEIGVIQKRHGQSTYAGRKFVEDFLKKVYVNGKKTRVALIPYGPGNFVKVMT